MPTRLAVEVENVMIGTPELVLTVTYAGVALFSSIVTVVAPQIEDVVEEPYSAFLVSEKNGYITDLELPKRKVTVVITVLVVT